MLNRLLLIVTATLSLGACLEPLPRGPVESRAVLEPVRAGGVRFYKEISAGNRHTCALARQDGAAHCWGANDDKQLGVTATLPSCEGYPCTPIAQETSAGTGFIQIIAGTTKTCALRSDGKAWCWGLVYRGAEGTDQSASPLLVDSDSAFVSIAGGDAHSCGLTAGGTAMCWGVNYYGQLGDSTKVNRLSAGVVAGNIRFVSLAANGANTCGISTDGDAWCWGDNRWGQVGLGEVPYNSFGFARIYPGKVVGGEKFTSIVVGGEHACALTTAGAARCWGRNENAQQLGDDSGVRQRGTPAPVAGGLTFDALTASSIVTCGHTAANAVYCWGSDYFGALGDGRQVNGGVGHPVKAAGGPYIRVAAGVSHTCALDVNGFAWCWGDGLYGQLGNP